MSHTFLLYGLFRVWVSHIVKKKFKEMRKSVKMRFYKRTNQFISGQVWNESLMVRSSLPLFGRKIEEKSTFFNFSWILSPVHKMVTKCWQNVRMDWGIVRKKIKTCSMESSRATLGKVMFQASYLLNQTDFQNNSKSNIEGNRMDIPWGHTRCIPWER